MRFFEYLLETIIAALVGIFSVLTVAQVVARYLLNSPFTWSEEIARYFFIWSIMFAAALGIRRKVHIGFDLIVSWVREPIRKWVGLVNYLIIAIFSAFVFVYGIRLFQEVKNTHSGGAEIPLGWVYSAVPAGFLVMLIFGIEGLVKIIRGSEKE